MPVATDKAGQAHRPKNSKSSLMATYLRFFGTFRSYCGSRFWWVLTLVVAGALTEGVGLVLLLPVLQLMADGTPSGLTVWITDQLSAIGITALKSQLAALIALVGVLIILRSALGWLRAVYLMTLEIEFINHLRLNLFAGIAQLPWSRLNELRHDEAQNSLVEDLGRLSQATTTMMRSFVGSFLILVQLSVSLVIAPALTLVIVLMGISCAVIAPRLMRRSASYGQNLTKAGRAFHNQLLQFFSALKLMKIQRDEDRYIDFFRSRVDDMRDQIVGFNRHAATFQALFQIASACLLCLVLILGVFVLETPFAVLVTVVAIVARASGPALMLMRMLQITANSMPAFVAYEDLMNRFHRSRHTDQAVGTQDDTETPAVRFRSVSFAHGDSSAPILNDLSLEIKAGEIAAITGPSGSGKTTVFDLISGLLAPASGTVEVGNQDARSLNGIDIPLAYVTQDTLLFDATVRENLMLGIDTVSDEQIFDALTFVGAADLVNRLPNRLDTRCGHDGQMFSGGERQRLALARALLRKPKLLLLDEATSALDAISEADILGRIAELRGAMTIILITHRPIPEGVVDQIFPLSKT